MNLKNLIVAATSVALAAFIGSMFTDTGSWYDSIKPSITPPNFVFPIVWTILFIMIAISFYFALNACIDCKKVLASYYANFVLNIFWSYLFFFLKMPRLASIEIVALWFSIIQLAILAYSLDKKASYLLVPYLVWVAFAAVLNFIIVF